MMSIPTDFQPVWPVLADLHKRGWTVTARPMTLSARRTIELTHDAAGGIVIVENIDMSDVFAKGARMDKIAEDIHIRAATAIGAPKQDPDVARS